jgi:hypothetical protein
MPVDIDPEIASIFDRFWAGKGSDCLEIVRLMSQRESWALDQDLGKRLDLFAETLTTGQLEGIADSINREEFVQLQAWLTSEKALMFASMLDEVNPLLMIETLELTGSTSNLTEPLALFLERIVTFSRARLIGDLFSEDRVRRVEKLARVAMQ